MIGAYNQQPTVLDSMLGTKTEWYNTIDEAMQRSDVIPGNYEYSTTTSYGNSDKIQVGGATHFDIGCDRFEIISLDNSYISLQQTLKIRVPAMDKQVFKLWYIGYKISAAAFVQYSIFTNTDVLQQVNHPNYEWYVLYNSVNDEAKESSDIYATEKKIREMNPFVPGVYVDLSAIAAATEVTVKLPIIRIPLSSFLLLFNLKYHPDWAGKLTLEVYPSYNNIVVAPAGAIPTNVTFYNATIDGTKFNGGFYNLNQPMMNSVIDSNTDPTKPPVYTFATNTFTCNECETTSCKIRLARNMLKIDVYNALAAKYLQVPLMFPIQTCQVKKFASELGSSTDVDSTLTLALNHCDAMFLVFEKDVHSTMCFENPAISYIFNIDGKFYPREAYNTIDDIRNINFVFDALNINNSYLTSIPNDLRNSLQPYTRVTPSKADGTPDADITLWCNHDKSNFLIGIPFADDDDFMGGISTGSSVQVQLRATRLGTDTQKGIKFGSPVGIFFEDKILKIRSIKPTGAKQIEITGATIEQILGNPFG